MSNPRKMVLFALWVLSLVVVYQWSTRAQVTQAPGYEVRFMQTGSKPGSARTGRLVAHINGQWLPVAADTAPTPDGPANMR